MEIFEKEDHKNVEHDILVKKLESNKNKTGLILGESCHIKNASVDVSTSLEGNKNKTGQKFDDSRHKILTLTIVSRQVYNPGAIKKLGKNWVLCLVMTMAMH